MVSSGKEGFISGGEMVSDADDPWIKISCGLARRFDPPRVAVAFGTKLSFIVFDMTAAEDFHGALGRAIERAKAERGGASGDHRS